MTEVHEIIGMTEVHEIIGMTEVHATSVTTEVHATSVTIEVLVMIEVHGTLTVALETANLRVIVGDHQEMALVKFDVMDPQEISREIEEMIELHQVEMTGVVVIVPQPV